MEHAAHRLLPLALVAAVVLAGGGCGKGADRRSGTCEITTRTTAQRTLISVRMPEDSVTIDVPSGVTVSVIVMKRGLTEAKWVPPRAQHVMMIDRDRGQIVINSVPHDLSPRCAITWDGSRFVVETTSVTQPVAAGP